MVGLNGVVACAERRTSLTFAQAKRSPPKSQMSGAVHLLAAKALHEYAERHKDDPIEGVTLPCDMPPRSPADRAVPCRARGRARAQYARGAVRAGSAVVASHRYGPDAARAQGQHTMGGYGSSRHIGPPMEPTKY